MTISVAIVAYNEEKNLPRLLRDIETQDYPHEKIEVLLIDSMSVDGTRALMENFKQENPDFLRVLVLDNPGKQIPCGNNVALEHYLGDAIVRIDAHTSIPRDFVSKNVEVLESGEDISGGRVVSMLEKDTPIQRVLLAAENSPFCGGVAAFRRVEKRQYVDTMAFGMYRRKVFDTVGRYNEYLPRSEDNDMSYRVRKCGFKMCLDPKICSQRVNRSSMSKLLKQKYLNGYWIGKTMGINPHCFSLYHFVPFVFVLGILATSILSVFGIWQLAALMWSAYGLLAITMAVRAAQKSEAPSWVFVLLPALFLLLHVSYGVGSLVGLIEMPFWCRKVKG